MWSGFNVKKNKFRTLSILLLILIEIILGVLKDTIVEILPKREFLEKYNIDTVTLLTVLLVLTLVVILLMLINFFQKREEHKLNLQDDKDSNIALNKHKLELNLRIRNKLVQIIKIEVSSRLEQSLHNRIYITAHKEENISQVDNSHEIYVKIANKQNNRLENTEIIRVYDQPEVAGRLLILGQPGSGKTTTLLKLSEELIKRAKEDSTQPIPVLFSLTTWKDDKQSIEDWLIEQLKEKYGVRKDIGKQLIDSQEITPLLDGLDDLNPKRQELCVKKINEFLKPENWTNPLVVCSRTEEYQNYQTLLQLNTSLELYPYSPQQVHRYLRDTGNEELWNSISNDADLSNLAKTPFFLNMIVLAAQDISIEKWQQFSSKDKRLNYLFDVYIDRILKRSYKDKRPTKEQTKKWLGFLSQRLIDEQSTEFMIENIQPYWLRNKVQKQLYSLTIWIVVGGFMLKLIQLLDKIIVQEIIIVLLGLFLMISGLINGATNGLFGLFSELIGLFFGLSEHTIQTTESLEFNLIEFFIWLISGLCLGLIFGLGGIGLSIGFKSGLILGLILGLINGINAIEIENKKIKIPNYGIRQSVINTLIICLVIGLSATLLILGIILSPNTNKVLIDSLTLGLPFGILIGIDKSGIPAIKHLILRILLCFKGYIPWNYTKFLNYCTNRLLLQQVGGSYRFINDSFRQYFASQYTSFNK